MIESVISQTPFSCEMIQEQANACLSCVQPMLFDARSAHLSTGGKRSSRDNAAISSAISMAPLCQACALVGADPMRPGMVRRLSLQCTEEGQQEGTLCPSAGVRWEPGDTLLDLAYRNGDALLDPAAVRHSLRSLGAKAINFARAEADAATAEAAAALRADSYEDYRSSI